MSLNKILVIGIIYIAFYCLNNNAAASEIIMDENFREEYLLEESDLLSDEPAVDYRAVLEYKDKLEKRLLDRYNSLPEFANNVSRVEVIMPQPIKVSADRRYLQVEFDQLVYDTWGNRLEELEKEYFIITFASGGVEIVKTEPSIRVGLDMENIFSEKAPLIDSAVDFYSLPPESSNNNQEKSTTMPEWWRPSDKKIEVLGKKILDSKNK